MDWSSCRAALVTAGLILAAAPAGTQQPGKSTPLARLEGGLWELRSPDDQRIAAICANDRLLLAQPQHGSVDCERDIVAADARSTTVHYTCRGAGFGRTTIRYETPRLVQIDSQGMDRGVPFALRAEARRVGPCG